MSENNVLKDVATCFQEKIATYGNVPEGVYWNSVEAQEIRFAQLMKVCDSSKPFSLIDYGCGYGALVGYMRRHGYSFTYQGYDIVEDMIATARETCQGISDCVFTTDESLLVPSDYLLSSGIFNLKLDADSKTWADHVLLTLDKFDRLSNKGFSFNLLTIYSDLERMRPELYYADPCFYFDLCKRKYSRNVALLHDYEIYDFTILVRKEL